jgi:hypothetical protein
MAKRLRSRLTHKTKASVKVRTSIKIVVGLASFAVVIAAGWLVYLNFGSQQSGKSNEINYLTDYAWRRELTINPEFIKEPKGLYQFPVFVEWQDPDFKTIKNGGKLMHPKAWDICVTQSDGRSKIPIQVDYFDEKEGKLGIWILIDSLYPTKSKNLFVYYSKSDVSVNPFIYAWPKEYGLVSHFQTDAHSKSRVSSKAQLSGGKFETGKLGNALSINAGLRSEKVQFELNNDLILQQDFTIQLWFQISKNGINQTILSNFENQTGIEVGINANNKLDWKLGLKSGNVFSKPNPKSGEEIELNRWYHTALVFEANSKKITFYIDGLIEFQTTLKELPAIQTKGITIGNSGDLANAGFVGKIDEIQIVAKALSNMAVSSLFTNQVNAQLFSRLGKAEELNLSPEAKALSKQALSKQVVSDSAQWSREQKGNEVFAKSNETLKPVSSSAQIMQEKLQNMQRVAKENTK